MTKIAIIDLDGVVADNTARFQRAEEAKQAYFRSTYGQDARYKGLDSVPVDPKIEKEATNIYWQTAFTPELVHLDTLIEGVHRALIRLEEEGYHIIFLTSRPEGMREATTQWLFDHSIQWLVVHDAYDINGLVMKSPAFKYVKTPVWKAGMVQTLANFYQANLIKFIDDEQANWDELLKHTPYVDYSIEWFDSLKSAVETIK